MGQTTLSRRAVSAEECQAECMDGKQLDASGDCVFCPQGTYRTKGVQKVCTACPQGLTTEATGAVSRAECDTPR